MVSEACMLAVMTPPTCSLKYGKLQLPGSSQMPSSVMNSPATILRPIFDLLSFSCRHDRRSPENSSADAEIVPSGPRSRLDVLPDRERYEDGQDDPDPEQCVQDGVL